MSVNYFDLPMDTVKNLQVSAWYWDVIRTLGYLILRGISELIDYVYDAIDTIIGFNLYTIITELTGFRNTISSIVWIVFSLCIGIYAIFLMINPDKIKISESARSILVSALFIISFPMLVSAFEDMKDAGTSDIDGLLISEEQTFGQTLLGDIIIDIDGSRHALKTLNDTGVNPYNININELLDNNVWQYKLVAKNASDGITTKVTSQQVMEGFFGVKEGWIDMTSIIVSDRKERLISRFPDYEEELSTVSTYQEAAAVLFPEISYWSQSQKQTPSDSAGMLNNYKLKKLKTEEDMKNLNVFDASTWFEGFLEPPENLYSYNMDFFFGIILLAICLIALLFTGLKLVKLLFEIIFLQVIAPLIFATDVQGTGRGKKAIQTLISTYVIFIIVLIVLKVFVLVLSWVLKQDLSVGVKILLSLGGAMFVLDGPDSVTKIIGIDAGVKNGLAAIYGVDTARRMITGTAKSAGKTLSNIAHAPKNIASGISKVVHAPQNLKNSYQDSKMNAHYDKKERAERWEQYKQEMNDNKTHSSETNQDTASEPNNDTSSAQGNQTASAPGNDTSSAQGNQTASAPGNDTSSAPGNQTASAPGSDTSSAQGNQTTASAPGNDTSSAQGNQTASAPNITPSEQSKESFTATSPNTSDTNVKTVKQAEKPVMATVGAPEKETEENQVSSAPIKSNIINL